MFFGDKDVVMTALSSSHDAHLGKIDGYLSTLLVSCALTLSFPGLGISSVSLPFMRIISLLALLLSCPLFDRVH